RYSFYQGLAIQAHLLVPEHEGVMISSIRAHIAPVKTVRYNLYRIDVLSQQSCYPSCFYAFCPTVSSSIPSSLLIHSDPSAARRSATSGPPDVTMRPCIIAWT